MFFDLADLSVLFALVLAALPTARVAAQVPESESVTFGSAPDFSAIRDCAFCCFESTLGCFYNSHITTVIGCSVNSCLCSRTDIRLLVTSHLQTCVSKSCSGVSGDVSIALSVFGAYCDNYLGVEAGATSSDSNGGVRETVTETRIIPLSTVTTTLEIATVQVPATTITVFPGDSLPNNRASDTVTVTLKGSGGLSDSGKIGLGVGLGIGIPLLVASLFLAYRLTRALTAPPEIPQPIQGSYID